MKIAERTFRRTDYTLSSPFGYRTNPITGAKQTFHNGVDYATKKQNWPMYALEGGTVTSVGKDQYGAIIVWITYPKLGFRLQYGHLDKVYVKKGQAVTENTIIGVSGMTGNATGIHLHLGAKNIGSNKWEDAEPYDYKVAKTSFRVGQEVRLTGYLYKDKALKSKIAPASRWLARITEISGNVVKLDPERKPRTIGYANINDISK